MHPPSKYVFLLAYSGNLQGSAISKQSLFKCRVPGQPELRTEARGVSRGLLRKCALTCRSTSPEIPRHLASESWEVLPGAQKRSQIMWLRLLEEPVPEVVPEVTVQRTRQPRNPGNCSHYARWLRPQVVRAVRRKKRRRFRLLVELGFGGLEGGVGFRHLGYPPEYLGTPTLISLPGWSPGAVDPCLTQRRADIAY